MSHISPISRRGWRPVILTAILLFALSALLGILSNGVHHDDDLTHFMMARWSWWYPGYLVHVWGRPGFTVPVALVAWIGDRTIGWHIARGLSAVVSIGAALIAAALSKRLGLRYWRWTLLLCYVQPLYVVLSYTTLTENFMALYLVGAVFLLHRRRLVLASVVFSLVMVTRLETIVLLPVWWGYIWLRGRSDSFPRRVVIAAGLAALWAPVAQNIAHFAIFGTWPVSAFFRPSGSTEYLATEPLAFLPPLLLATTPIVLLLATIGGRRLVRRGAGDVVALAAVFLATHWLIKWLGVFASGGFARFVVAVAPLLAISAAAGLEIVVDSMRSSNRRMTWIGGSAIALLAVGLVAARIEAQAGRLSIDLRSFEVWKSGYFVGAMVVACVAVVVIRRRRVGQVAGRIALLILVVISAGEWAIVVKPLGLKPEQVTAREVSRYVEGRRDDHPVFAANPWIAWFDGLVEDPTAHKGPRLLSSMPVGTIFVWDSIYSPSDYHRLKLERYRTDPAYREIRTFGGDIESPLFVVFEKVARTPLVAGGHPYPRPLTLGRGERLGSYYERE